MKRPEKLLPLILSGVSFLAPVGECSPLLDPTRSRPNIVFIFTDDHSTAAISAYGSKICKTPNLDRLADEGLVFDNAFCTNGICAPSRAVVLTGKHSHLNGVMDNGNRFDGSQVTFPKLLRDAGYQTALIGKWHLKTDPTGFDYWDILPGQGHYYSPDFRSPEGQRRISGYVTDITTDLALDWLQNQRDPDQPFLLMCQHKAPHRSWMPGPSHHSLYEGDEVPEPASLLDPLENRGNAIRMQEMTIRDHMYTHYDLKVAFPEGGSDGLQGPDRWAIGLLDRMSGVERTAWEDAYRPRDEWYAQANLEGDDLVRWKYQRYIKDYLRCIASVDDNVGRLLDYLDQSGLSENTVVIYSSDQGFFLGEHGFYDKRFMYEPSLRMPLIVRGPMVKNPGRRNQDLVQNLDFAETFLDTANVPIPAAMQGRSLLPLIRGETPDDWRSSIYYQYFEKGIHAVQPHYGVRTDRYKLIHYPDLDEWELFDLEKDPDEMVSLHDDPDYAGIRDSLGEELQRLRKIYLVPSG